MLQNPMLDIVNAVALLSSLQDYISTMRPQFDIFERRGQKLTGVDDFHRKRRPTTHHGGSYTDGSDLNAHDIFKVDSFLVIIDKLTSAMSGRTGERTFSQLKRIKNELRSTVGQKRMNFLLSDITRVRCSEES